jgi:hypothetical protein
MPPRVGPRSGLRSIERPITGPLVAVIIGPARDDGFLMLGGEALEVGLDAGKGLVRVETPPSNGPKIGLRSKFTSITGPLVVVGAIAVLACGVLKSDIRDADEG